MAKFARTILLLFALLLLPTTFLKTGTTAANDDLENYTYKLTQSTPAYQFWTTLPSERVFKDDSVPTETGSGVKVYAAQNEFEPFQIVVNPVVAAVRRRGPPHDVVASTGHRPASSGSVTVSIDLFSSGITAELYQVKYVNVAQATDSLGRTGDYPDPLWPLDNGASVALTANENTAFWFSLFVPPGTASGDYTTDVHIGGISIPITLHVFNFAIPDELHVKSQMNFSHETVLDAYSVPGTDTEYWMYVDAMKRYFIDHRLTPKGPLWPGGLTAGSTFAEPFIDYDCDTHTFTDPHGIWGFEHPADKYLNGNGFNDGAGFPAFMAASFAHNDPSQDQRPDTFCEQTRSASDWLQNPASAYNQAWFAYVTALRNYLDGLGYLDEAYHYFANEPQDQADYDAVAWYSRYAHNAAPDLKLMVSEEPRSEIYDQTDAHIDIWLPVLQNYDPDVSHDRESNYSEETWIYFLYGTRPPYFNPITLDHPGIESKLTGWFLWKYRVRGIAYYSLNDWSKNPWTDPMTDGHNGDIFMLYPPSENNTPITYGSNDHRFVPSIRFELMRDSLEDYEYLYVLSGGQPKVDQTNTADTQSDKIISGLTSYTRHSEFMYNLRRLIGLKNGGEIAEIPDVQPPGDHPRTEGPPGDYYINFQDPAGGPTADPLVVNEKEYMKIGWNEYEADTSLGYGWYGDTAHVMYQYLDSGPNELQRSIIYDDWGRQKTFEFDLPNGVYNVTVSVGWEERTYEHHKITIEGVSFVDDEATTPSAPYIARTEPVTIADNKLTMEMGIFDEYTMLNYLDIEAITPKPVADFTADQTSGSVPLTVHFTDASTNSPTSWEWDFENDGVVDTTTQHPTHAYEATGVYSVKLRVTNGTGSDEVVKENFITAILPAVTNLRVVHAVTDTNNLTATLQWTPLAQAITTTLRYSITRILEGNWTAAILITDTLPGAGGEFTASVPYDQVTRYFALKSQDAKGAWLGLSNVAFWPGYKVYLPLILR